MSDEAVRRWIDAEGWEVTEMSDDFLRAAVTGQSLSPQPQPSEDEWADMTNPDGTYDSVKLMAWIQRNNRRRAKELAAAWGTYAPLYFPWHDGTEKFGE